eukprot:CAMPEP_0176191656 /NCGR_PEP_ID=MMETSP0121_2-20121125/4570_1 /TAXON_ID=160619 /ORGANISM="Kryptoperidinium foliaceum, Strain CCMP 1326" /LENGTH=109 /DNA_ID=CAMNT_0017530323 /DNA_START=344 /DNA_END=669 /DNA_ORIENTATION=-
MLIDSAALDMGLSAAFANRVPAALSVPLGCFGLPLGDFEVKPAQATRRLCRAKAEVVSLGERREDAQVHRQRPGHCGGRSRNDHVFAPGLTRARATSQAVGAREYRCLR